MIKAVKKGLGFGLTSGVITTLGMLIGLYSVSNSKTIVIGGILSIAIADSVSDALGIHLSEESQKDVSHKYIWQATIFTFLTKFIFALSFLIPIFVFPLNFAVIVSLIWGVFLISFISYKFAKDRNENPFRAILEHLSITIIVLVIIYYTGKFINHV